MQPFLHSSRSFTQCRLLQGSGRVVYADGSAYTGMLRDSLREGIGVMVYADASRFEGEWRNDCCVSGMSELHCCV